MRALLGQEVPGFIPEVCGSARNQEFQTSTRCKEGCPDDLRGFEMFFFPTPKDRQKFSNNLAKEMALCVRVQAHALEYCTTSDRLWNQI